MKRLTLNETWVLCLAMWKWIAEQVKKGEVDVKGLKEQWLKEHGFGKIYIPENCFFCAHARRYDNEKVCGCAKKMCPGALVNKRFSCTNKTYNYEIKPIAFYNKLVSLNSKRKKGKK